MPGPVFLDGDGVTLRTVEEEDLEFLQRNINDSRVRRPIGSVAPTNENEEREWIESTDDAEVSLLVCVDGKPVGTVALSGINETYGHAEVGYWITPDSWGEGYATAATRRLVGYAVDQRRLHKLLAHVFAFNAGSCRVLEKVGFVEEGRLREEAFVDGEYVDVLRYGLLASEWHENRSQ